jgi:molecular chaperone DnaJ
MFFRAPEPRAPEPRWVMDFYVILGVAQDATTADIKRAYRRLARRYHPGINPGDRAADEMFQRVSEAYETLVDPGRRRHYDAAGTHGAAHEDSPTFVFAEFDFSVTKQGSQASTFTELFADVLHPVPGAGPRRSEAGADIHASLTLSFTEAVRGVQRQVVVTRQVPCGGCGGAGQVEWPEGKCGNCQGTGQTRWARGHMVFSKPCAACGGSGRLRWQRCAVCAGQGRTVRSEAIAVPIPPGVMDGAQVRLPECGHAGWHSGRAGDLYVAVHVQPHPLFEREGYDLVCELPVAVHEAALGARVDVPSLDGTARLRIPPGTQTGQRVRLEGRGLKSASGASGDLVFIVRLVLPDELDERSQELMREFAARNARDVRSDIFRKAEV